MSDAALAEEREHILKAIKCVHARVPSQLSRFFFKSGAAQSLGCGGPCCTAPCSRVRRRWVGAAVTAGVRRLERHVWCIRRCLATVRRLKRGSTSEAEEPTVINHTACASSLRWRACLQPSVVWILQAPHAEARQLAKKAKMAIPTTPGQQSVTAMWSQRVSPIWSGP
jgi:hypothetical protein